MSDFFQINAAHGSDRSKMVQAMTLEEYRALDAAGKITRPLTLGGMNVPTRAADVVPDIADTAPSMVERLIEFRKSPTYTPPIGGAEVAGFVQRKWAHGAPMLRGV